MTQNSSVHVTETRDIVLPAKDLIKIILDGLHVIPDGLDVLYHEYIPKGLKSPFRWADRNPVTVSVTPEPHGRQRMTFQGHVGFLRREVTCSVILDENLRSCVRSLALRMNHDLSYCRQTSIEIKPGIYRGGAGVAVTLAGAMVRGELKVA